MQRHDTILERQSLLVVVGAGLQTALPLAPLSQQELSGGQTRSTTAHLGLTFHLGDRQPDSGKTTDSYSES